MLGILMFGAVPGHSGPLDPGEALPDRRVLYVALFLASAALFGAPPCRTAGCLPPGPRRLAGRLVAGEPGPGAVMVWSLVEAPALLGTVAYSLTQDFRTLLAPFTGLLFFANYRPRRLAER